MSRLAAPAQTVTGEDELQRLHKMLQPGDRAAARRGIDATIPRAGKRASISRRPRANAVWSMAADCWRMRASQHKLKNIRRARELMNRSRCRNPLRLVSRVVCLALLAGVVQASFATAGQENVDLLIFGDSLSDAGNAAVLGAGITVRPFVSLIPDGPYYTLRFSNDRTWAERLARRMGVNNSGRAALLFFGVGKNYAVGGARARDFSGRVNLPQQVDFYLSGATSPPDPSDVVVVAFGGNDVRDAIEEFGNVLTSTGSLPAAQFAAAQILCQAVASIEQNIALLHGAGARRFLVANSPNLGLTPAITSLEPTSPGVSNLAAALSATFNRLLTSGDTGLCGGVIVQGLSALESKLAGLDIALFDVFALLTKVAGDPRAFGLSNGKDACIRLNVFVRPVCRRPGARKYVFWDGIHPTAAMHRIVARRAHNFVKRKFLGAGKHTMPDLDELAQ